MKNIILLLFILLVLFAASLPSAAASVPGMLVYDTTLNKLSVFTGSTWETVSSIKYKFKITIDHTKVSGTNSDFVYLFSQNASSIPSALWSSSASNGQDIRFYDTDGTTELKREIVSFDGVNHTMEAWVQIPSLSSGSDKVIYCQCDGTAKANDPTLWTDAGYVAVYHFNSMINPIIDSTGSYNGTNETSYATPDAGQIGQGGFFNCSQYTYIDLGGGMCSRFGNHQITVTAWINPQLTVKNNLLDFWTPGSANLNFFSPSYRLSQNTNINNIMYWPSWAASTSSYPMGSWCYEGWTYNGTALTFYGNGNADGSVTEGTFDPSGQTDVNIGRGNVGSAGGPEYAYGILDEVRIANVILSSGWIKTEYNNQGSPATFSACSTI